MELIRNEVMRYMEKDNFKVSSSKKELLSSIGVVFVVGILMAFAITRTEYIALYIVSIVFVIPICVLMILYDLLFKVNVSGKQIKVRSYWGRKYEFDLSDINTVSCERTDSLKSATHFFIILVTETEKLKMSDSLTGFDQMASYILYKHDTGEIKQEAISKTCRKMLNMYKNNEQRDKRKNKKD
ncbi:MAG: hypothetical protein KBG30_14430 [Bacteroidales bacterium]|jgi:hypothetical protein|nr:hypothetical protein [Bacteroidales bacterium]